MTQSETGRPPARIHVQSRECSPQLLERLTGATLFPERMAGSAIVNTVCRDGGRLLYVTAPAMADADAQIDYYLGLAPGGARDRVQLLSLDDTSSRWLSEKLLDPDRPEAAEVRAAVRAFAERQRRAGADVRMAYFEPSEPLETLAADLGTPGDQARSRHIPLGTKDASRALFTRAGIPVPAGSGLCRTTAELAAAVARLAGDGHRRLVLKLNSTAYGGGLGNALLELDGPPAGLPAGLPAAVPVDPKITWADFVDAVRDHGAIVEEWVTGEEVLSPSFQGRITETGEVEAVSTHDQSLGPTGQTFTGCSFPADAAYRAAVIEHGLRVGRALAASGVDAGDYGADFLAVRSPGGAWRLLGCELNLRATGTKHAFTMAEGLLGAGASTDGRLLLADGGERVYEASDALMDARYTGLRPAALIDALTESPLHYDPERRTGAVLHMLSAVPAHGKFGALCIGADRAEAARLMRGVRELADSLADSLARPAAPVARAVPGPGPRRPRRAPA